MIVKIGMLVVFFAVMDPNWNLLQKTGSGCQWICAGRAIGRSVADGICLWNLLFFRRYFRRAMLGSSDGGSGLPLPGLAWGMPLSAPCPVYPWKAYPYYDPASGFSNHAGVFRCKIRQQGFENRSIYDYLLVFDPLYSIFVQRTFQIIRNGISH